MVCLLSWTNPHLTIQSRYAWLSIRETRARRFKEAAEEEAAITARAAHLECLQNGNHPDLSMTKTLGLQTTSPGRNGLFEPAVSSVRDEPAQPVHSMDGVEPPHEVSLGGPPEGDQPEYDVSISTSIPVNGDNAAVSFEDGAKTTDPKRILAHQLLEAALSRPDPAPEPYKSERKPVPPSPKPTPPPKSLSIKDMIKLKMLPIDFAVNAARLAMGEGAEDDDEDFGDLPGVSAMGGTGMEMEMQVDPAGDGAVEPPFVASLDIL